MTAIRRVLLGMLFSLNAFAQTYPNRPVTFIVPWPPGGSTDLAMRSISIIAEKHLGQRIIIENKPGVSGTMGAQALAQRTKRWPAVPTLKDVGYPLVSNSPYGLAGPKSMDPAATKALHDAFKKALEDPEYLKSLEKFD